MFGDELPEETVFRWQNSGSVSGVLKVSTIETACFEKSSSLLTSRTPPVSLEIYFQPRERLGRARLIERRAIL